MQFKLTKKEKSWIFYDVGNSAFVLMVSTILPVYFNYLAQNAGVSDVDYLAYWGYAASISTLIVAVLGPVMGTLADTRGFKKPLFLSCILVGCAGCLLMGLTTWWISFLVIFIIAKVGFNSSLVFYDSMLSDVTAPERMDRVSSSGYAWGYAGSCIPFIVSLVFVLGYQKMGFSFETGMMIAFAVVAVWWLVMSLPLMKQVKISFPVSYFSASLPNRMENGNATNCVTSNARSSPVESSPRAEPYAVAISIIV